MGQTPDACAHACVRMRDKKKKRKKSGVRITEDLGP